MISCDLPYLLRKEATNKKNKTSPIYSNYTGNRCLNLLAPFVAYPVGGINQGGRIVLHTLSRYPATLADISVFSKSERQLQFRVSDSSHISLSHD